MKKVDVAWQFATTAAGTHKPRGITRCYLPSGRCDIAALSRLRALPAEIFKNSFLKLIFGKVIRANRKRIYCHKAKYNSC